MNGYLFLNKELTKKFCRNNKIIKIENNKKKEVTNRLLKKING